MSKSFVAFDEKPVAVGYYFCQHNTMVIAYSPDKDADFPKEAQPLPVDNQPCDCKVFNYKFKSGDSITLEGVEWTVYAVEPTYQTRELLDYLRERVIHRDRWVDGYNVILIRDELVKIEMPLDEFLQSLEMHRAYADWLKSKDDSNA
jgi:hypothetical protein